MSLPFADKNITLFNYIEGVDENGRDAKIWHSKKLSGCTWTRSNNTVRIGENFLQSDEMQVQIPQDGDYLPEWEFSTLTAETVGDHWTGKTGLVVVLGHVDDVLEPNADDTDILTAYEGRAFRATSFEDNTGQGVPLGHYVFRG